MWRGIVCCLTEIALPRSDDRTFDPIEILSKFERVFDRGNLMEQRQNLVLYRSERLLVRLRQAAMKGPLVVCFDPFSDDRRLERRAWGEDFLLANSIDAAFIVSSENEWYQFEDLPEALGALLPVAQTYDEVIAYGSSMGGYAAIRYGGMCGAKRAIAISPQFSIDPRVCPWERRWFNHSARISFRWEDANNAGWVERAHIAYDPLNDDAKHVALLRQRLPIEEIALPFSGHPAVGFLAETGLLSRFALEAIQGRLDSSALAIAAKGRRRQSAQFLNSLAQKAGPRRSSLTRELLRRATVLSPDNSFFLSNYAAHLSADGDHETATNLFLRALAGSPNNPVVLYHYAEHLERSGNVAEALNVLSRLDREHSSATYGPRYSVMYEAVFREAAKHGRADQPVTPLEQHTGEERRPELRANLSAIARGIGGRIKAYTSSRSFTPADTEVWNAVTPSPPHNAVALRRHLMLSHLAKNVAPEIALLGDSHAEFWPTELWQRSKFLNLGVAGDKTQNTLWRIERLKRIVAPPRVFLVFLGTNNLGIGDAPMGIMAGFETIANALEESFPASQSVFLTLPPTGPAGSFRANDRKTVNEWLMREPSMNAIDIERVLAKDGKADPSCYWLDQIHLSFNGYAAIQGLVDSKLAQMAGGT